MITFGNSEILSKYREFGDNPLLIVDFTVGSDGLVHLPLFHRMISFT